MVMENTNPFTGTCGTISWQLLEINMRLIIMWSVPFNFNIRDSYYAIGLTHNKVCTGDSLGIIFTIICSSLFIISIKSLLVVPASEFLNSCMNAPIFLLSSCPGPLFSCWQLIEY